MEKTTLSTTLPRIFDGELVYMRSTQTTVGGGKQMQLEEHF
jgi:hypothetical protein